MHIFVDESGTFIPQTSGQNSVSAVGALVIPSASLSGFEKLYGRLRRKLPKIGGEVKGRLLSEAEVGEVVTLLKKVGSIFEIVAIDSAHHTPEILEKHRMRQAEAVTHHLTDEFHPDVVKAIWALRTQLEDLSLQLYVQSIAMVMLVYHTIYHTNLYFSLRTGAELGSYHWVIDAKERDKVTPWEEWWSTVILPWIESKSFREPFAAVEGGDYRAHDRFRTEVSDYKKQYVKDAKNDDFFDLRPMLREHLRFSSQPEYGLEASDILVNAIRRSMSGNFQRHGWLPIRSLMIHRSDQYVHLISLRGGGPEEQRAPYRRMLNDFRRGGRVMLTAAVR